MAPPLQSWPELHTLRFLSVDATRLDFLALLLRANPNIKVLTVGLCDTDHGSLGDFGKLMLQDGPGSETNEPVPPAGVKGNRRKGWAKNESAENEPSGRNTKGNKTKLKIATRHSCHH
jgi:hypothetical protein